MPTFCTLINIQPIIQIGLMDNAFVSLPPRLDMHFRDLCRIFWFGCSYF